MQFGPVSWSMGQDIILVQLLLLTIPVINKFVINTIMNPNQNPTFSGF